MYQQIELACCILNVNVFAHQTYRLYGDLRTISFFRIGHKFQLLDIK
ncbi:MAG: hypothetical protein K0S44_656 [Bacteroidetes bacterium]|jgi:hypothetical protein|nr:hypothetical protein [Bacteroidota bacterium]